MNQVLVYIFGVLFSGILLIPTHSLIAKVTILSDLSSNNTELQQLRREIALNLKSTARGKPLAVKLRLLHYKPQTGENFFRIMARLSQDLDTLVSLNHLANPNALVPGQTLLIPNARGLFLDSKKTLPKRHRKRIASLPRMNQYIFVPGERMPDQERRYFRGEGFQLPLAAGSSRISSGYGSRRDPFHQARTFHGGIDMAAARGTPVFASRKGTVIRAQKGVRGYGTLVVIQHKFGYTSWYGHLSKALVRKGNTVMAGQKIGLVGSTGRATGPHLHFEIRKHGKKYNPAHLIQVRKLR